MNLIVFGFALLFSNPTFALAEAVKAEGAGHVGGGDAVACDNNADFQSKGGLYSLDYAIAVGSGMHASDFASFSNWQESSERLSKILGRVSLKLKEGFDDFVAATAQIGKANAIPRPTTMGEIRWWSDKGGRNDRVFFDPKRGDLALLPKQCHAGIKFSFPDPYGDQVLGMDLVRIVERKSQEAISGEFKIINYGYDEDRLVPMFIENPLSASFFMVHEWLWDLTDDIKVSRDVNIFLHSKEIEKMAAGDILLHLRLMGLEF